MEYINRYIQYRFTSSPTRKLFNLTVLPFGRTATASAGKQQQLNNCIKVSLINAVMHSQLHIRSPRDSEHGMAAQEAWHVTGEVSMISKNSIRRQIIGHIYIYTYYIYLYIHVPAIILFR